MMVIARDDGCYLLRSCIEIYLLINHIHFKVVSRDLPYDFCIF